MFRVLLVPFVAALLVLPALPAPATRGKKADEPLGPITDEHLGRTLQNLKQIALGFHSYNDTNGNLPNNERTKDGKPLLSWRVQILPYIEQEELYKQFKLDEPWDSEHNKKLVEKIPAIYAPVRGRFEKGQTFYQVVGGKNGLFPPGVAYSVGNIPDGTSNTFLVVEAAKPVIWTKPEDLEFDGKTVPALGGMFDGKFHAAIADGSVIRFRKDAPAAVLKMWMDPSDGQVMPADRGEDAADGK